MPYGFPGSQTPQQERTFKAIFGFSLSRFWNPILGFDVIKFDEWLKVPDGVSTADFVTAKYGEKATEFIRELIGKKDA